MKILPACDDYCIRAPTDNKSRKINLESYFDAVLGKEPPLKPDWGLRNGGWQAYVAGAASPLASPPETPSPRCLCRRSPACRCAGGGAQGANLRSVALLNGTKSSFVACAGLFNWALGKQEGDEGAVTADQAGQCASCSVGGSWTACWDTIHDLGS